LIPRHPTKKARKKLHFLAGPKGHLLMPSHTNLTPPETPRQSFQPRCFLCSTPVLYQQSVCPNAQTLLAYDIDHDEDLVLVLNCKQWSCRWCSTRKIAALASRTRLAEPNRLLTLTVNPALFNTPRDAFDATRRQVPVFFAQVRQRFDSVEYLRVTEATRLGWPHYHCMVRSPYLPHPVIKSIWSKLTGAVIVDVRQVHHTFKAYTYLVKYLSKVHSLEWTERHVSFSRGFFPPIEPGQALKRNLTNLLRIDQHPYNYLAQHYAGRPLCQTTPGTFLVGLEPPPST
jgi:hypothetical protein